MTYMKNFLRLCPLLVGIVSCTSNQEVLDTPRKGTITIAVDESLKPLVHELTSAYENVYPETHFNVDYKPEQEAILQLLQDSARLAFVTRDLSDREMSMLKGQQSGQKTMHVGTDGVAMVVSKTNGDSLMTMDELSAIFDGRITTWTELKGSKQTGPITLVFDNANSSNLNYIRTKFNLKDVSNLRIISAGSNEQVIQEVKKNPLYLGFVGVNLIGDNKSKLAVELSQGLTVFGISKLKEPQSIQDYFQPFQDGLRYKKYPLTREIYIISREGHSGLGGGLMTYIARDVGGLIIQKMGLLPRISYPREVEVTTSSNF
jgi:phosphate transport system substrate-binding protein